MSGLAQTLYITHSQRGISGYLEAALSGIEIKNGVLHSEKKLPYAIPSYVVTPLLNSLFGVPVIFNENIDSVLIIDTTRFQEHKYKIPVIIVKSDHVRFILNKRTDVSIPYRNLLLNKDNLVFNAGNIRDFLLANFVSIFMCCLLFNNFQNLFLILFSIFFLAIAAFIFRIERERRYLDYFKIACFAVSPICVGIVLISLSGVKIAWIWHILIFFSTIVMFRAIVASGTNNTTKRESEDNL